MSRLRRVGLRREPPDGWPLDGLFVGVATLRTTREMFLQGYARSLRAWDLALWSGVTAQGSAEALARLRRLGLVEVFSPDGPGHAPRFRLDRDYPLLAPLAALFEAERVSCRGIIRPGLSRDLDEPGGSATPA